MVVELKMSEPVKNEHGISSRPDLVGAECDECGASGYVSQMYYEAGRENAEPLLCPDCNDD